MKTRLILLGVAAALTALISFVGCADDVPLEDARTAYFATLDGTDEDCEGWLQWCIDEGYPQSDCEERNEYCVDGEWVGGDGDDEESDDPCEEEALQAERDCLEDGGTEEDCREAGATAYEDCASE